MDPQTPGDTGRPRSRRWIAAALVGAALVLSGCQLPSFGAYRGQTAQGHDAFKLWQGFFIAGLVVGGFVFLLILYAVLRYRRRSEEVPAQTQYHTLVEILYTTIPILIVLALFGFTVATENEETSVSPHPALKIDVVAFQWGWEFYYPGKGFLPVEGAASLVDGHTVHVPNMMVPTGETVQIELTSKDVIHGFYVPAFDYSEYAMPGLQNYFDINVTHTGWYRGQCTQLCGLYHSEMLFNVHAVSQSAFATWVSNEQSSRPTPANFNPQIPSGSATTSGYAQGDS